MLFSKKTDTASKNKRQLSYSRTAATKTACILFFSVISLSLLFNIIFFTKYQSIRNSVRASEQNVHHQINQVDQTNLLQSDAIQVFTEDFIRTYLTVPKEENARQARTEELSKYFVSGFDLKRVSEYQDFKGERQLKRLKYFDTKHISRKEAKVRFQVQYEIAELNGTKKKGKPVPKITQHQIDVVVPVTSNGKGFAVYQSPNIVQQDLKDTMSYEAQPLEGKEVTSIERKHLHSFLNEFFRSYGVSDEKLPFMADLDEGLQNQLLQDVEIRQAVKNDSTYRVKADVYYQNSETSMTDLYSYELKLERENEKFFITHFE
ncbi:conjugal transfer protein [Fictibacillus terranigra]|uniref:Conjugal transfer protein n=1 Tax=Fictibacillus terranigra TaxID=3058424 RepID=A0ABT8E4S9_9BACL|nr:conjugal transfer protein [Fictibacillus sp. CENA-BCM004]MDN4072905.1 conjugal transfer protein [Fictibacillus sp. CENA-BCM004]